MKKQFSITDALQYGYSIVTKNLTFFLSIGIITFVLATVVPFFAYKYAPTLVPAIPKDITVTILRILFAILSYVIGIGSTVLYLRAADGKFGEMSELFSTHKIGGSYFILVLGIGIITLLGFLFFIIPGIILSIIYQFAVYFLVEDGKNTGDAMSQSKKITEGNRMKLFGFAIVSAFIEILGILCLGVGYLFAAPIVKMAHIYVYRKLRGKSVARV